MDIIHTIMAVQSWSTTSNLNILAAGYGLFGVSPLFVLLFIVKLMLLFAISAFISKLLKLDKYYDDSHKQNRPD